MFAPGVPWRAKDPVPVAVVWDVSASMAETDGEVSRWAAARAAWKSLGTRILKRISPVHLSLGSALAPVEEPALDGLDPGSPSLAWGALGEASRLAPGARAALFFSDGRGPAEGPARAGGIPVWAVGVGGVGEEPDLAVEEIRAPALAFSGLEAEAEARVSFRGRGPVSAEVGLFQEGRRLARARVTISSGAVEIPLPFLPSREGLALFEIRAEPAPGERRLRNNRRAFGVNVQRDRVRALYVAGRPGPHYGFLRAQLKTDPAVELVSFVILRDPEDALGYADPELSLIPFPSPAALAEQLKTFDVVILEDPAGARFGLGNAFDASVASWVRAGGGLLVVAEPSLFSVHDPLSSLLPWTPGRPLSGPALFRAEPADPAHPLLSLAEEPERSAARWKSLSPLEGNGLWPAGVLPGARVLLREPRTGLPLLAERSLGRGRAVGLANDTTWRWALGAGRRGEGPADYQRFWQNMARWLAASPGSGPLRLSRPEGNLRPGETWRARLRLPPDERSRPTVWVRGAKSARRRAPAVRGASAGEWTADISFEEPGFYEVRAEAGEAFRDRLWVEVAPVWDEGLDTRPDFDRLKNLARETGGAFIPAGEFNGAWLGRRLERLKREPRPLSRRAAWALAGLAFLFLAAEWILRRRAGLP